jgi:Clp amino terminal domain, pathogenicity island component
MTLDELITQTRSQAPSAEPLTLLTSAAQQQQELADLGEKLLDHFVQEARSAGCSWSQIGTALGVSKQAAQQRHSALRSLIGKFASGVESALGHLMKRFTPRARRAVVLAREEARTLGHDHLGTEHLLLGLLAEGQGVAAQALQQAGISLDAARAEIMEITDCGRDIPKGHIPFTLRAKKVLELALREAFHLNHHFLGTEHILLGLIREGQGVGAQVLVKLGANLRDLRASVLALLETGEAPSGTE